MSKYYITTPIYYVNAKPHLGHAYTTLAADVLARYHRLKGDEVFFLTGTDEHGAKVAQAAEEEGKQPQEFVDEIAELYKKAWENLDISHDKFIRTTDKEHQESVDIFMQQLKDKEAIYEGEYKGLYCTGCENFVTEKELDDQGNCPDHGKKPEQIKEKNYFFKFADYVERVKDLIERDEIQVLPVEKKNEVLGLVEQGLDDFSVSRQNVDWGLKLPFDKKQVIYVWIEALQNYISAIGYGKDEDNFKKWWPAKLHLIGKDIIKFHALFWPAMLLAAGQKPPQVIYAHGYFTVDGEKMSKTKGNVIDPKDMVEEFGVDATRYLILSQFPFERDGDIKAEHFAEKYNSDLANNLGNLVSRVSNMIDKYFDGKLPEVEVETEHDFEKINRCIEELKFDQAINGIQEIIAQANQVIEDEKPWEIAATKNMDKLAKLLTELSITIQEVVLALEPFMPNVTKQIQELFEQDEIRKTKPLFPRIYNN